MGKSSASGHGSFFVLITTLLLTCMLCACGAEANEYNPVYLVSSKTIYSVNGNTDSQSTYEYDKSGNLLSVTTDYPESGEKRINTYSDYDSNGCYGHMTNNGKESDVEWEIEDGLPTKMTIVSNGFTATHTYDEYGRRKSSMYRTNELVTETNWNYDENQVITVNTSLSDKNDNPSGNTAVWKTDEEGRITSIVYINHANGKNSIESRECRCDENGNIVEQRDHNGNLLVELQYVRVDNPSKWAWILAQEPQL